MASSSKLKWLARCTTVCISFKHLLLCLCQSGDAASLLPELGDRLKLIRNIWTEQQTGEDVNVLQFGYTYRSAANFLLKSMSICNSFTGSDVKLHRSSKQLLTHSYLGSLHPYLKIRKEFCSQQASLPVRYSLPSDLYRFLLPSWRTRNCFMDKALCFLSLLFCCSCRWELLPVLK